MLLAFIGTGVLVRPAGAQGVEQAAGASATADTGLVLHRGQPGPLPTQTSFAQSQLRYDRVLAARVESRFEMKRLFRERGIHYPAAEMFLRVFKRERQLELWVRPSSSEPFALLKTYNICALAGELGPKRRQGDEQVPEGFYYIDQFNPQSDYHLSLHLDYPNRSDAVLGNSAALGGDVYIHGGCSSAGCLALTDDGIKEVYWMAVEAKGAGQSRIPVHIFPARLTTEELPRLAQAFRKTPAVVRFWQTLRPGFDYFEREHRVPRMNVSGNGTYQLAGEDRLSSPGPLGTPAYRATASQPLGTQVGGSNESRPAEQGGTPVAGSATAAAAGGQPAAKPVEGAATTSPVNKPLGDTAQASPKRAAPDSAQAPLRPVPPSRPGGAPAPPPAT